MAARFSIAESQKNRCSLEDVISYIYVKSLFPKKGRGFFVCGCLCALLLYQHLDGLVAYLDDCHRARQTGCVQRCNACGCNDRIELYAICNIIISVPAFLLRGFSYAVSPARLGRMYTQGKGYSRTFVIRRSKEPSESGVIASCLVSKRKVEISSTILEIKSVAKRFLQWYGQEIMHEETVSRVKFVDFGKNRTFVLKKNSIKEQYR